MIEKIVVVTRKTRLEELVARFNTREQARFYIEHAGSDFSVYQTEHDTYQRAVETVLAKIGALGRVQLIERAFLPTFIFIAFPAESYKSTAPRCDRRSLLKSFDIRGYL